MFRNYLIGIHRYYAQSHGGSMNFAIMPAIVAGLTISSIIAGLDMSVNNGMILKRIVGVHELAVVRIMYLVVFTIYLYYRFRLPSESELRKTDGKWLGVIACIVSVAFAMIASII